MKKAYHPIIIGIVMVVIAIALYVVIQNSDKNTTLGCIDRANLQNDSKSLATRQQVKSIILANPEIKQIVDNSNYCEFMGISIIDTENGTYRVININLNNTKELSALVNLQNNSVISYELGNLTRSMLK